ncbi:transcription cofactor vestigial-like protein 2 [Fukomys damarensis]|uniref:transcription cofactor vestigial-like protein 2 n=1 Tax=Fukomys damarensis TaxID=885580 RepID=UPI0014551917|nr:transcription cofactor vestigial-like protein 2 [Fukomys damarensis]
METYTCVLSLPEQKLAYYSKMQEAPECTASPSSSGSSSFSSQTAASIKEEEGSSEKERPPEAEYINSRCVLLTYFQGDISSVVDEHFSRALSQPSSYSPSCASSKAARSTGPWRGEEGPCWAVVLSPPPASTQGTSDPNWEERQEDSLYLQHNCVEKCEEATSFSLRPSLGLAPPLRLTTPTPDKVGLSPQTVNASASKGRGVCLDKAEDDEEEETDIKDVCYCKFTVLFRKKIKVTVFL